jgi:hypothetical protein
MTLEGYLADQYNLDQQDVTAIEHVLVEAARTFAVSYDKNKHCWPYQLQSGDGTAAGQQSQGTTAMILAALGKSIGCCTLRDGHGFDHLPGLSEALPGIFKDASIALAQQLRRGRQVDSGTFGKNNPLTVSHLTELARGLRGKSVNDRIIARVTFSLSQAAV